MYEQGKAKSKGDSSVCIAFFRNSFVDGYVVNVEKSICRQQRADNSTDGTVFDLQKDFKRSYKKPTSGDATEITTLWFRWSPDITVNEAELGTFNVSPNYGAQGAESLVLAAADEANGVAAKTVGDYLELGVQRSGESEIAQKSFNAWKSDAPIGEEGKTPTMRIDVFQNYVGIYVNDWSFTRDDIKTLTIKQGFMPVEVKNTSANKNPDNRGKSWYAPAEIKSGGLKTDYALPADPKAIKRSTGGICAFLRYIGARRTANIMLLRRNI